jgi:outer membrane protein
MKRAALAGVLAAIASLPPPARGELRPLWEIGAGATVLSLPDYRGADQSRGYVYPFPYVIYRGDRFKADREGIRGMLFDSDRVKLDISAFGTPPIKSNPARAGMPDLDPTLELGPSVNITLARHRVRDYKLDLRLPVRAVLATDFSDLDYAGIVAYPNLTLDLHPVFLGDRWNVGLQVGSLFGTSRYHAYFYGVPVQFATPTRPPYTASGGYSGAVFLASLSRRFRSLWVGGFVRYDNLNGVAFDDSPLFKRDYSVMAGLAAAWIFYESAQRVEADE